MVPITTQNIRREQRQLLARRIALLTAIAAAALHARIASPESASTALLKPENMIAAGAITSVTTDASATPSTVHFTLATGQNAVAVWTDEKPGTRTEKSFNLYVTVNGSTRSLPVLCFAWGVYYVSGLAAADTVSFGTSDGRTLKMAPFTVPTSIPTLTCYDKTLLTDGGLPGLWTPTDHHLTLPSTGSCFVVKAGASQLIYIREYDDTAGEWTPPRWFRRLANTDTCVQCTFRKIAIATETSMSLDCQLPIGSTYNLIGYDMAMDGPAEVGTPYTCTNITEFKAAVAAVVAGVRNTIILADGTYAMDVNLSDASFTANQSAGNTGMSGCVIRSASNDPTACIWDGSSASLGGFTLTCSTDKKAMIKGIGFDDTGRSTTRAIQGGGPWSGGQGWRIQNCRSSGTTSATTVNGLDFQTTASLQFCGIFLDCVNTGSKGDAFAGNANAGNGSGSLARFYRCTSTASDTLNSIQALTAHTGLTTEAYGGTWTKTSALENAVAPDSSSVIGLYFGYVNGRVLNCGLFGMRNTVISTTAATDNVVPKNFCSFVNFDAPASLGSGSVFYLQSAAGMPNTVVPNDCRITCSGSLGFIRSRANGFTFERFIIVGGIAFYANSYQSTAGSFTLRRFTVVNSFSFVDLQSTAGFAMAMNGNALKGCTNSVMNYTSTNNTAATKSYNVLAGTLDADYSAGTGDVTSGGAALSADYFPTASGNADGTNLTTTTYVGGTDVDGFTTARNPTKQPIGARELPGVESGDWIFPSLFFATVTTVDEPRGGIMSTSRGLGMGLGIDIL